MRSTSRTATRKELVISPPYLIAPDLGVVAVDVTLGLVAGVPHQGLPLVCLGGHPAGECLLDVRGSGPEHDVAVAVDTFLSGHRELVERLRSYLSPSVSLQVVTPDRSEVRS